MGADDGVHSTQKEGTTKGNRWLYLRRGRVVSPDLGLASCFSRVAFSLAYCTSGGLNPVIPSRNSATALKERLSELSTLASEGCALVLYGFLTLLTILLVAPVLLRQCNMKCSTVSSPSHTPIAHGTVKYDIDIVLVLFQSKRFSVCKALLWAARDVIFWLEIRPCAHVRYTLLEILSRVLVWGSMLNGCDHLSFYVPIAMS